MKRRVIARVLSFCVLDGLCLCIQRETKTTNAKKKGVVWCMLSMTGLIMSVSFLFIGESLEDWYNAGPSSAWTAAVKAVVVKGDGTNLYE